jgi:hypothetical protein
MNRNVWAIVAIVCLDLAILWFIRGSIQPEELVEAVRPEEPYSIQSSPTSLLPKKLEIVEGEIQPVLAYDSPTQTPRVKMTRNLSSKPARETFTARRTETIRFRKPRNNTYSAGAPVFTDTIIWVKRPAVSRDYYNERLVVSDVTAKQPLERRSKKKTILSRAVPVIKKPYQWLKTLVSKI